MTTVALEPKVFQELILKAFKKGKRSTVVSLIARRSDKVTESYLYSNWGCSFLADEYSCE